MAERRATNKYYPPEWDPSKGGVNKFRGSHHLRDRARKLKDGIMIVRFELAFHVLCEGECKSMLAKGVRFNAEKKKIGDYFSTPIWEFKMKCPNCSNEIIIKTDPQTRDYVIVSGAKKKVEDFEFDKQDQAVKFLDEKTREKLSSDALFKLEHENEDVQFARDVMDPVLEGLKKIKDETTKDDYAASKLVRKMLRDEKKQNLAEVGQFEKKYGAIFQTEEDDGKVKLLKLSSEEAMEAQVQQFRSNQALLKQKQIRQASIFDAKKKPSKQISQVEQLKITVQKNAEAKNSSSLLSSKISNNNNEASLRILEKSAEPLVKISKVVKKRSPLEKSKECTNNGEPEAKKSKKKKQEEGKPASALGLLANYSEE